MTFSDTIDASAVGRCTGSPSSSAFCVVGPDGPIDAAPAVVGARENVIEVQTTLRPATEYQIYASPALLDGASNLHDDEPLFSFRTRAERPQSGAPEVVSINGVSPEELAIEVSPPAVPPVLDFASLRVLFSEPIDRRSLDYGTTVHLIDGAGDLVPANMLAQGPRLTIDPDDDLVAGAEYRLLIDAGVLDIGGAPIAPFQASFRPADTRGDSGHIPQMLRTRGDGDPGPRETRAGTAANSGRLRHTLVGAETLTVLDSVLASQLGDPEALGGPIAFVIRKGQRMTMGGLDVRLGGEIPAGLATGDITIQFLSDAHGVLERNPYRPAETIPDNDRAPVHVRLVFDVAITARDGVGNAVLTQTVLGVQATGIATPTDGVLAIETVMCMELDLLGVARAPTNIVLELINDADASTDIDRTAPELVATYPEHLQSDFPVHDGMSLVFDEPIDMRRARAGGIRLEESDGTPVLSVLEQRGGAVVIRPLAILPYDTAFRIVYDDVADTSGNALTTNLTTLDFTTADVPNTNTPIILRALYPGVACALVDGDASQPGRCAGGATEDDKYAPFTVAPNDIVEAVFHQPVARDTLVLGASCNTGSVRVETADSAGDCTGAVAGTLLRRQRSLAFVPDEPWQEGQSYRLVLISGGNQGCDAGEVCSVLSGDAANFDPLGGTVDGEAGGPDVVIPFTGAAANADTFIMAETVPLADQNGSGALGGGEVTTDNNRAALKITGVNGDVTSAVILDEDCVPSTPEVEGCMYLAGHMPVAMGELTTSCPLPGGGSAPSCIPMKMFPQPMFGTSLSMESEILGIGVGIATDTGMMVMRVREAENGQPVVGYVIDDGGSPKIVVSLRLYMDAPDMEVLLSEHDLHSKEVEVTLEGPMTFFPDGRFQINLSNVDAIPMTVNIDGPIGVTGSIDTEVPAGEMRLQLLSRPLRGGEQ